MSDFDRVYDQQTKARARRNYIQQKAPMLGQTAALLLPPGHLTISQVAKTAVDLADAIFRALPPDPDEEQGSGAPAQLDIPPLPAEKHPCHDSQDPAVWRKWHGQTTASQALWQERMQNVQAWPSGAGLQGECRGCGSTLMARWEGAPGAQLLAAEPEDTRPRVRPARVVQRVQAPAVLDDGAEVSP